MNRSLRLLTAPFLLALLLVACSGTTAAPGVATLDEPSADPSASPTASVDPEEARLEFARCMREHGVDMPDPGSGGRGFVRRIGGDDGDREKLDAAMEACREHLEGAIGERGPELTEEQRDAMLEFAKCMREHGIDMPDPGFDGPRVQIGGGPGDEGGLDPESPEFQDAMEACQEILGDAGPGQGGLVMPAPDVKEQP